ncbi:MAG: DUF1934 domain-containing protein [Clostridia bacterium]|nr:DUF1934 domain-containing protein [Clostridia bacterium]
MKKACKISIESVRKFHLINQGPSLLPEDLEEAFEMAPEEEPIPEELAGPMPSDGKEEAERFQPVQKPSNSVLTSYGIFSKEDDGSFRITYEDSEITGLEGCLTTFCLSPSGMLILLRGGEVRTCMVFEESARHLCDYGAAQGAPSVVLHTHTMKGDLNEKGGTLFVDYSVEMCGTMTERNELSIRVEV